MEKPIPANIINIPTIENFQLYEMNQERANSRNLEHCPVCGKGIKTPRYFINTIWGGNAYPKHDTQQYPDAWVMAIGSECRKKLPPEYVMTESEYIQYQNQ